MANKWTTTKALKALNNARADVAARKDDEDFTYEPWAVPDAEQQINEAEEINNRYAQLQQNGPSDAVLAGRQTMTDYNDSLRATQEAAQRNRENEQRMLQNALTVGSIDSYKAYKNATADQQAALENAYTTQLSGSAKRFKDTYGVSNDDYDTLMDGYKTYRKQQAANANESYASLSTEQKTALNRINRLQSELDATQKYASYNAGMLDPVSSNDIVTKTKELNDRKEKFKSDYGVDETTYSTWLALQGNEQTEREAEAKAHAQGKRTQSQEMEYASKSFQNAANKATKSTGSKVDSQTMKSDIYSYIKERDTLAGQANYSPSVSNYEETVEKNKAALKSKYGLSDDEFDDLLYYGQELYDSDNRKKQQQDAYDKVHQDSKLKNISGGIQNSIVALATNLAGGVGGLAETGKYLTGIGYRDKQSAMNVNSSLFGASNVTSDYQGATQQAINDKNKALGILYGAGMSAVESAETSVLAGLGGASRVATTALSLAPFAANAYASSLSENVSDDKSMRSALTGALKDASIETLTEIASADKFWDMAKSGNSTLRNKIVNWLAEAGIEGTEEVAGNIADRFLDSLKGSSSDYNKTVRSYIAQGMSENDAKNQATKDQISEDVESFLSGAISGGISGGIALGINSISNANTANNLFDGYTSKDYAEWAEGLDTDPASYKNESVAQSAQKAKDLATKMSQEATPSKREKTQLYEYYQDMMDTENEAIAEEQESTAKAEARQQKWDSLKDKAQNLLGRNKTTTEQSNQTTDSEQESISHANVPEQYQTAKNNASYNDAYKAIQSSSTQEELNEAIQTAKNSEEISWEDYEKLEQTAGSYAASKNNLDLEQAKISTEDAYTAGYSGQEIGNVSPALQIAYNDGVKQAASDRAEQTVANREEVQKAAAKQSNDGLRTIIESNYKDGMNAALYNDVMASAITAGRTGASFEDYAKENGASLSVVGEDLARTAFTAGQQVAVNDAMKEAARSLGEKTNVKSFGSGTFTDARTDTTEAIQGSGVIKAIARMTGLDIVLTDQNFTAGENGYYKSGNSTIYINSNQADRMASTLFHEVGEFASVWNQKEYSSVVNDIMQASQKALGSKAFESMRQKYANAYRGEEGKTDADIDKEMANDLLYQFLGNEQGMNKLMDQIDQNHDYKEAKSIKQRLADWISKMVDSIKSFLAQLQPNSYQRRMAEASLENYEALQDSIARSIANAEKNYNATKEASAQTRAIEEGKGSIEDYGVENESSGEKRLSIETYEHGGREYLENFLENTDDLTDEQKDDILDHMEWAYNLAKDLAKSDRYEFFGQWSQTALAKNKDGVPLIEVRTASDSKPIRSVAVNNGEYPLNIDFSQVCKKRSTLNAVLNYMVKNYGMNLRTLTASDVININQAIKNHGFEIACGLCFVDAKRYRTGAWASTFTEGTRNKKGELKAEQPGYNNLVRMIRSKDGSDVGYSYFNFATSIPAESARTIDQLSDDELDFSKLKRKLGKYAKYDENGNLIGIGGYKDNAGKTKNPTETIRLAWAIYSNPEMRHLISEEDLISSDGLDAMRDQNSTMYSLVNAHWGAGKPKLSHGGTAYGNEILRSTEWGSKNDFDPESAAKVGGVRVQSFSDYEANMFFDYMQLFADMSARQLTSHAYTKEPYYAKLFGMTGQKINLSVVAKAAELTAEQQARYEKLVNTSNKALLEDPEFKEIAEHAGLGKDENGNWTRLLIEDETFPLQEALDIQKDPRYNGNCGIIWIGISDAQIRVLLDSDDVPMVIPYHSSGVSKIVKKARNLLLYTDYTNQQNTRTKDGKKITGKDFDFYGSLAKTNDVITTTNEYLAWCEDHGYLPKFDQFADHPNYYKLLIDFRAYDYNGVDPQKMANRAYQPQQKITMNFPENFNELVTASLAEQQATKDLEAKEFTDAQGSLLNDVKDVLGLSENGVRKSVDISDNEKADYVKEQDYSYERLTSLDPVHLVKSSDFGFEHIEYSKGLSIRDVVRATKRNIEKYNASTGASGDSFVTNNSIGRIITGSRGIRHGLENMSAQVVELYENLPTALSNAIVVNEADGDHGADKQYVLIGAFINSKGGITIGRFGVDEYQNSRNLAGINLALYSSRSRETKKEGVEYTTQGSASNETVASNPSFEISVAELLDLVKDTFPNELSGDVEEHFGYARGKSDIRNLRYSVDIDSEGSELTPAQQKYFADSKVRDEDGNLLVMYHGTSADFNEFDRNFIGAHGSFEGYGFNFTPSRERASGYSGGRILKGYANVTNPLSDTEITMTTREFASLIAEADPTGDDIIANYAYETMDYGTAAFVKREAMTTARTIMDSAQSDVDLYSEISAAGGGENLIDLFKKMGYDGLIHHNEDGSIKTVITFESNQFKNADNENPTQAADIRRAVGIDETWNDDFDWSAESEVIQSDLSEALHSGNEILKGTTVNEANIRRIARQLKNQYDSKINVDEFADTLSKVFAYAQQQDYINYDDLATVVSEVASPLIEQATVKTGAKEFKDFKQALQSYTFNLDERQQKEVISAFGSWGAFRKALPGIKFTRDGSGVSLDGAWEELCKESGYVLSRDVTSNDMPLELVDAYRALKPTYENAFGEDAMNATQDAAMEIVAKYYQYAAQQEKLDLKKRQKEELEKLSKKIAETNAKMRKDLQKRYNKRLEREIAKAKKENKPEKVSVQVARLRARNAKTVASIRERQKRKDQLRTLNRNAARLVNWVTDPTDTNHIPAMLQTPVMELVSTFDFVPQTVQETADGKYSIRILESRHLNNDGSYSYKWKTIKADTIQDAVAQYKQAMKDFGLGSEANKTWQDRLETIHDLYQQDESDDWYERSELKQGLDKNLGEQLGEILRNNKGMLSIAELSSDELQTLNDVILNVMHAVRQVNRMYSQPSQQVSDVAHMVMDRAGSGDVKGRKAHGKRITGLIDTFTLDHAAPVTYLHGVFGTEEIDPITKTMIKAQNQKARDIRQAQEYMEEVKKQAGVDAKTLKKWMYDAASSDHNTRNFYGLELAPTQVMSLYELMKRPDAQQHKVGGFVVDETGRKSDGTTKIVHLTDEQIKSITDTLSDEQKAFADAMQHYLANDCAQQGNETAMQLYGYEKYLDEHYFPMSTDKNTIATRDSNVTTGAINAIKNSGFTKKITPNATNALVLKDIFTVFSEHVSEMATYHSWAAPLQDMIRFFNYNDKVVDENGFVSRNSVKNAIDYFYGKGGQKYFTELLSSINAREKSNFVGGKLYEALTGNAKAAAVMGNLRVVIQQPTAFMRAGEMIRYKYLNDGLEFKYAKEAAELRDRTSDVFWLKNQGNIDGYITQGMVSTITGIQTFKESVNEKAGWLAGKADEVTWAAMYRAVYAEQVDKLGKNKVGTKEFEDAVNERFSEIMLRTQVYDGTITRSQFMRSTDMTNKVASAFMAEPVKTYNIVLWHMIDLMQANNEKAKKKAMKGLVWAAYVLTLTNAANAVAQSIWDAFRNAGDPDDEDENFLQRFLDALGFGKPEDEDDDTFWDGVKRFIGGNFVDNMDLLSNIPMVADYWEAVKSGIAEVMGESSYSSDSDLSMAGVTHFFDGIKAIVNPSDTMTAYGKFAAATRAFSDLTGYPVYAVQRDAVAVYNTIIGKTFENAPLLQKNTKYSKKQQAKLDVYTEALEGGDFKQAIEDAYNAGNSYDSIKNSITSKCKDQYLELKETNPNEATQMKNRLAQMYVYLANKTGAYKDKTDAEKLKTYTENIEKWEKSEEDDSEE